MRTSGARGWLGLVAFIYLWDKLAEQTLTSAFWGALTEKSYPHRGLVMTAWAVTTAHLFRPVLRIPAKYDLFTYLP